VDHLEHISDEDIQALKGGNTMPVALPGCSLFLKIPYTPARQIIDAGLAAGPGHRLQSGLGPLGQYEPGKLAGLHKYGYAVPEEVINASTLNGAYAMDIDSLLLGSITCR
jgi:imidazolonepropionase